MKAVTGEKAFMWGTAIVGFSAYQSNTGQWPIVAFSPRKAHLVVYIVAGFSQYGALLAKLGRHRTGGSCLYLKRLADVDTNVLADLVGRSVAAMRAKHAV